MIGLEITTEETSPSFAEMTERIQPRRLLMVTARAAKDLVRDHLAAKAKQNPNAMGAPSTGYYSKASQLTHFDIVGDGAVISINEVGMSLHYYGGTVVPGAKTSAITGKPTQYLTIPARAEAHGHRASEFPDLIVLWGKNGPYALARAISTAIAISRPHKDGSRAVKPMGTQGGEVMFWLVKRATIQPDPTVIPSAEEFQEAINAAVREYVELQAMREGDTHE